MPGSLGLIALVTTYLRISELQVLHYFETWKNGALFLGFWIEVLNCIAVSPKYISFHRAELGVIFHLSVQAFFSVALVRERTIPTERPPPVGEVSANFCG